MKTVRVMFERGDDGWWLASVPSVPGCLTQGRTIEEARRNIRDALGMFPEEGWSEKAASSAEILDEIHVPERAKAAVAAATRARHEAAEAEARAKAAVLDALREVTSPPLRLSTRDAAALLGLSGQRVQQLLVESGGTPRRPRFAAGTRRPTGRLVSRPAHRRSKRR